MTVARTFQTKKANRASVAAAESNSMRTIRVWCQTNGKSMPVTLMARDPVDHRTRPMQLAGCRDFQIDQKQKTEKNLLKWLSED